MTTYILMQTLADLSLSQTASLGPLQARGGDACDRYRDGIGIAVPRGKAVLLIQ